MDIRIEPFRTNDSQEAAHIVAEAFGSKMPAMARLGNEMLVGFILDSGIFTQDLLNRLYVARLEGRVAGILHLEVLGDKLKRKTPEIRWLHMFRTYGFFRIMLSALSMILLDYKLKSGEMYVDFIAVHPDFRGKGMGSRLMEFAINEAGETEGIDRITLSVIKANRGALKLYERIGFRVYDTVANPFITLLSGVEKAYRMALPLSDDH